MRFAVLLVGLVACEGSRPAAIERSRPRETSRCEAALGRTRAAAVAVAEAQAIAQFDECWDGWAAALDVLCSVPARSFDNTDEIVSLLGRWVVMYTARDGAAATYVRRGFAASTGCISRDSPANIAAPAASQLARIEPPKLFDFDGDGTPEIWLAATQPVIADPPEMDGETLKHERVGELLTYKRKVISRYAPALELHGVYADGIEDMKDVDGDGRPDLLLVFNSAVPPSIPRRVAHSLPDGTFSETDAVARQALFDQCPATSELIVIGANGALDIAVSLAAIACAALRGELGRDISRRLASECGKRPLDCHELERWANDMYLYRVGAQ